MIAENFLEPKARHAESLFQAFSYTVAREAACRLPEVMHRAIRSFSRNPRVSNQRFADTGIPNQRLGTSARNLFLLCLAFLTLGLPTLHAQQRRGVPHIGYIYPAGVQVGTSAEILIGGEMLDGVKEALITGSGVHPTVVKFHRPLPMKRINELREYLEEARKRMAASKTPMLGRMRGPENVARILKEAGATDEEIKSFEEAREKRKDPKRQQNQQIAEIVTVKLQVAPDAPPGVRELRLLIPSGATNPLSFCVGRLPEQSKAEGPLGKTIETAPKVTLPAVLNGQILPGEVDHYSFQAKKGANLVIAVQARDLIPYLADAVPGWFQPVVSLYDAKGKEVAYADDFRFSPDPALSFKVPADGAYLLEIKDSLYRGREDFVYRITIGEVPFITGIFPMGCRVGSSASVTISGWNLTRTQAVIHGAAGEGIRPVPELGNGQAISDVPSASDSLPEITEQEPNDEIRQARQVNMPIIINGRIDHPGDIDTFGIACGMGARIVADVSARRLGSPLDSWLRITDAAGRQVAFNDDWEDKAVGLLTHKADSYILFTAPVAGMYFVQIGDAQHKGGPEYGYRLRIGPPRPDFALRVVPSAISSRPGGSTPITIYAARKDGFQGEIAVKLNSQPGFVLDGGLIPAGQDKIRTTVTFPPDFVDKPANLAMIGNATVDGRTVSHPVVPADDMVQAFVYHHLVPARQMLAVVSGSYRGGKPFLKAPAHEPITLQAGGVSHIALASYGFRDSSLGNTEFVLGEPPEGVTVESVTPTAEGVSLAIRADAAKVKPGVRGNLIFEVFRVTTPKVIPGKESKAPKTQRYSAGFLPAIPYKVAGR